MMGIEGVGWQMPDCHTGVVQKLRRLYVTEGIQRISGQDPLQI